ncbi:uncharacterized protein EAF01_000737 [Botrytis porri]|uniref:Aminoglycoside phosphotransferase domain-containing protein n=1 Tax=Botrytis porri TaxID=87229 RepID=A0A4Z1L455_9HELO|nr:uncharacterized protein EAF01_000737 [Botrytis porri]KAF7914331.1 hypothetical protein EAF01_000737 [Botrytis porri]TGO91585.1 hypothetical protein BPOR_0023g00100 [Botrytis porri]
MGNPSDSMKSTPQIKPHSQTPKPPTFNVADVVRRLKAWNVRPIPRLLNYGINADGTRYLVTELISGVTLNKLHALGCRVTSGKIYTEEASCATCVRTAYSNAINLVENTVSPQLSTMKSYTRGINGFVMPPAWLPLDSEEP